MWKKRITQDDDTEESIVKSAKDGIIKTDDAMLRKKKNQDIEPMPKKQLQRIIKGYKRQGGMIQMDEMTDKHLSLHKSEGAALDAYTILLKRNPGRAAVFEELIHASQYRQGILDGSRKSRLLGEIEAQKKLIENSKAYGLTEREVSQTKKALSDYEKELEEYLKEVQEDEI